MPRTSRRNANDLAADGRRIYSLGDVKTFTGVPRPQAQYWVKKLVIVPDYPAQGGTGNYNGFSFRNLVEFAIAKFSEALPVEQIKGALVSLRGVDPDDWYDEMPRMRQAIAALPKPAKPATKGKAIEWITRQERKGGIGSGNYGDPKWHVEAERYLAFFGDPPPHLRHVYEARSKRELAQWRRFKNPAKRDPKTTVILSCRNAGGYLVFGADELYDELTRVPSVVAVNLSFIFANLEKRTCDHWNNKGGKP